MGNTESNTQISTQTQQNVDLEKYAGVWYEIATIKQPSENQCEQSVAFYLYLKNSLQIYNYCINNDQIVDMVHGVATVINEYDPSKLSVKLDGWRINKTAQYWIYDTDYKSYAIVGGGNINSIWILSRNKRVSNTLLQSLLGKVTSLGYDRRRLYIHADAVAI
jgi:apolipoprotein D and lipocalin family protein